MENYPIVLGSITVDATKRRLAFGKASGQFSFEILYDPRLLETGLLIRGNFSRYEGIILSYDSDKAPLQKEAIAIKTIEDFKNSLNVIADSLKPYNIDAMDVFSQISEWTYAEFIGQDVLLNPYYINSYAPTKTDTRTGDLEAAEYADGSLDKAVEDLLDESDYSNETDYYDEQDDYEEYYEDDGCNVPEKYEYDLIQGHEQFQRQCENTELIYNKIMNGAHHITHFMEYDFKNNLSTACLIGTNLRIARDPQTLDDSNPHRWSAYFGALLEYLATQQRQRRKIMQKLEEIEEKLEKMKKNKEDIERKAEELKREVQNRKGELEKTNWELRRNERTLEKIRNFDEFFKTFVLKLYDKYGLDMVLNAVQDTEIDETDADALFYLIFSEALNNEHTENAITAARQIQDEDLKERCVAKVLQAPRT